MNPLNKKSIKAGNSFHEAYSPGNTADPCTTAVGATTHSTVENLSVTSDSKNLSTYKPTVDWKPYW